MAEKILHPKPEAGEMLGGISPRSVDYLIASGKLEAIKIGSRTLVTHKSIALFARTGGEIPKHAKVRPKGTNRTEDVPNGR